MKRLVLILSLVLLLALAACDTMGPTAQEGTPTVEQGVTGGEAATPAVGGEVTPPADTAGETADAAGADLRGVTWEWVSLVDPMGQTAINDPTRYTITFNEGGVANVKADCNNVIANYFTDGVTLTIEPGISTLAACPEDSQDQLFVSSLGSAASYIVEDGELFITLTADSGTLMFRGGGAAGAGEAPQAAPTLTGVTWEWTQSVTSVETIDVVDPTRYTITFNNDGTANIKADCNSVLANYTTAGESMTLTMGPSTLVACPEDSQVDAFLAGLAATGAYMFDGNDLLLRNVAADGGVMRFRAAGGATTEPPATDSLTGVVWQWASTTTPTEEITVADPTRYTIIFNEDGTAGIKADCNVGNATYTTGDDSTISITLGVSTLAFCENSQDQQFRTGLSAAAVYFFQEGDLYIDMLAGSGTMRFVNGGSPDAPAGETEAPAGDVLTGVTWQWVSTTTPIEQITVADPTRYTITFNEDGTVAIKNDCNTGSASYTTGEGGAIDITPGPTTLAMCPEDSQSAPFMAGLDAAAIYFFQDGDLFMDMFAGGGTMRFAAQGGPDKGGAGALPGASGELVGTNWQLTQIAKTDGAITVNDPTRYTITFNADGTANWQADCNVGGATYTTGDGGALTITMGVSTMAYCGPGSLDQIYLGGLSNAMSYAIQDGNLVITMLYESGTLVFSPAP